MYQKVLRRYHRSTQQRRPILAENETVAKYHWHWEWGTTTTRTKPDQREERKIPAHTTAKIVMASARLMEVRQPCFSRHKTAEIKVPA